MAVSKNKPYVFFFLAIVLVSFLMFAIEWRKRRVPSLVVAANKGIAELLTLDGRLVAVFQDGRTCVWDWNVPEIRQADFTAGSGRAVALDDGQLAVMGRAGDRRLLSIYRLDTGRRIKDITAGWEDQDIHLRNSHGLTAPTLMRRSTEREDITDVEFVAVNLSAELLRPPVSVPTASQSQTLRDAAVSDTQIGYAAGSEGGRARRGALEMHTGRVLWDAVWDDCEELTTVAVSIDGQTVWCGDRAGNLLTIAAEDGQRLSKVSLLRPGETRAITNDYSVLNLVVSPDGRRLGCTIAPVAYAVDAATGNVTHRFGGHKVVSKVAFSPDSRKLATSDLRADGTILIQSLE